MLNKEATLEDLRKEAGISQAEMAAYLETSQAQVSRYEKNPDEVSVKIDRKWREYCGNVVSNRSLELGNPMEEIVQRKQLIADYCKAGPNIPDDFPVEQLENGRNLVSTEKLIEAIERLSRKPRVGLFGRFDMGKSRLANLLMGGNNLPANYQPATSIACLVRHIDDKPMWQPEPVWIFGKGFDLDRPDDEAHCKEHRLIGGSYDTLREHGTHGSEKISQLNNAIAAVVYVDSPFLKGCDIIDLPGYQHQAGDDQRAEMAHSIVDVVIYVATAQGFMNEQDRGYLAQLIRNLPAFESNRESDKNDFAALCNLYVVATRADIVGSEITRVLDKAAVYSYDSLGDSLVNRSKFTKVPVDQSVFRHRFFTYSAEQANLRESLDKDLSKLLIEISPLRTLKQMEKSILEAKASGTKSLESLINTIQETLEHRESARSEVDQILRKEPERIHNKNVTIQSIVKQINDFKEESKTDVKNACDKWFDVDHIEKVIKQRYDDKKKATELAPAYIVEQLQKDIGESTSSKSEQLSNAVNAFLDKYDASIGDDGVLSSSWNFNAKGAFAGALAGLGTFGALATWASVVAAGSNLGGYILAAKIVSALSAIGVSVGGTATVASVLSVIGGPVTIAIGIALAVGAIATMIFGDSWERKLAKKIAKGLKENDTDSKILLNLSSYWEDTEKAFLHATHETEEDYQRKLRGLREIAFNTDIKVLELHLNAAQELRDYFAGIPWKRLDI